jgi:Family of unknown function (DUF6459)
MPPSPPTASGDPRPARLRSTGRAVLPLVPGSGRRARGPRPLPDAAAVRLSPVPDCAPPYDDDPVRRGGPGGAGKPAGPRPGPRRGPRGAGRGEQPQPAAWPGQFAQVLAETLAGSRPQDQIRPWTTEQALRRIRQLGPMLCAEAAPRVRRIVASRPAAGVVEMSVIVGVGPSIRALAVRLEHDRPPGAGLTRWICTAIEAA